MWVLVLVSEIAAVSRLLTQRLWRLFPFFCTYLVTDICRSLILWELGKSPDTTIYRAVWLSTEPWAIVLDLLVTLELYQSLYRAYPGIHRFARVVIGLGLIVSIIVAFGTLSLDLKRITWRIPDLQRMFLVKRIVSSVIAVLLAVTIAIFPRAECAASVIQHGWLLTFLFSIRAFELFLFDIGFHSDVITFPFLVTQCCLYLFWALLKSPTIPQAPRSASEMARTEKWNRELLDATRWLVR